MHSVSGSANKMNAAIELFNEYQDPAEARQLFDEMRQLRPEIATPADAVAHILGFRREVGPMIVDGRPTCLCANVWEACHQIAAMGKRRMRWAVPLLARLLFHQDPDFESCPQYAVQIQAAAARALGAIGDTRAIAPLLARIEDGPTYVTLAEDDELGGLRVELDEAVVAARAALESLGASLVNGPASR
jgi:hypothetical protein